MIAETDGMIECDWCHKLLGFNGDSIGFVACYATTYMVHRVCEEETREAHKDEVIKPRDKFA